jgi:hypothetical protein
MKYIFTFLLLCSTLRAGTIDLDNLIAGPIPGNDNAALVSSIVDRDVELVGKFEIVGDESLFSTQPEGIANHLNLEFQDQGLAFFFASGVIKATVDGTDWDYLVAKSGPNFFVYERTGDLTYFETDCHFLSHVSLYRGTPEPGSGLLLGLGSLFILRFRRRR